MRSSTALASTAIALLALAACKGGSGSAGPVPTTSPTGSPGKAAVAYVANSTIDTVTGYLALQTSPSISLSNGVSSPVALAVDGSGNVYVDNCQPCIPNTGSTSKITVYAQGSTTPARTIAAGLSQPAAIAVTSGGTLYVANEASSTVTAYAPGSVNVAMTITNAVAAPIAIALDSSGNIYVGNGKFFPGTVSVYSSSGALLRTLPAGGVEGVAVDSTGRVYISNCNTTCGNGTNPDSVMVYQPNSTTVAYTIAGGLSFPTAMVTDASNNLYVANSGQGSANDVVKFAAGSSSLVATIDAPGPSGLAIDKNGILYVTDGAGPGGTAYNKMTEWQNGSTLTVTTGITNPAAVAVGSQL